MMLVIFIEVFKLWECVLDTWVSCGATLQGLTEMGVGLRRMRLSQWQWAEKALSGAVFLLRHMAKQGNCHHFSSELSSCEFLSGVNV